MCVGTIHRVKKRCVCTIQRISSVGTIDRQECLYSVFIPRVHYFKYQLLMSIIIDVVDPFVVLNCGLVMKGRYHETNSEANISKLLFWSLDTVFCISLKDTRVEGTLKKVRLDVG